MKFDDLITEKLGSPRFNRLIRDTVAELVSEASRELRGQKEVTSRSLETRITALRGKFSDQLDAELGSVLRKLRKGSPVVPRDRV